MTNMRLDPHSENLVCKVSIQSVNGTMLIALSVYWNVPVKTADFCVISIKCDLVLNDA